MHVQMQQLSVIRTTTEYSSQAQEISIADRSERHGCSSRSNRSSPEHRMIRVH